MEGGALACGEKVEDGCIYVCVCVCVCEWCGLAEEVQVKGQEREEEVREGSLYTGRDSINFTAQVINLPNPSKKGCISSPPPSNQHQHKEDLRVQD